MHGVDFHYLTAAGEWKVDGQLLHSDVEDQGVGRGGFVDVGYTVRQGLVLRWGLSHFDDKFSLNDLGFNRRNDITNTTLKVDYTRSDIPWLRKASFDVFSEYEVNGAGENTKSSIGLWSNLDLRNQDQLRMGLVYFGERVDDRNSRGNGSYLVDRRHAVSLDYYTDSAQRFSLRFGIGHNGEDLGGERIRGKLGMIWRPRDQINVSAFAEYRKRTGWLLWQEDRNLTTFDSYEWRPRINLDYFLTAKQQLRFSAQWVGIKASERDFYLVPERVTRPQQVDKPDAIDDDFAIANVNLQLRYRWEIAPLSELSVVYTLNGAQTASQGSFEDLLTQAYDEPVGEQLIVKLRYRLGT